MNSKALFNSSDNQGNWKTFRNNTGRSQGRGKFRYQNNGKQCTHCHGLNHTINECYFKYGFPPWYKQKGEKNERVTNSVVMDKNMKIEEEQENKSDANNGNKFTQGQIYQIMQLIQETKKDSAHKVNNFVNDSSDENTAKGKNNEKSWVLDTGATDHVNYSINNFLTFRRINPIRISLPNGLLLTMMEQ